MKRSVWIASGVVVLVLLLAGAAFVAGRLLSSQEQTPGPRVAEESNPGGESEVEVQGGESAVAKVQGGDEPAELPDDPSEVTGVFVRREDNSIFIGTGNLTFGTTAGPDGSTQPNIGYDGPVVEVVTTRDTVFYRETTFDEGLPEGDSIQQTVEPGLLDEIGEQSGVTVWGERSGDRVVARVLLYLPPPVLSAPLPGGG
ncbi:MAG: hypothetical protein KAW49_01655 [Anaerolineae bacterium]|nr:hypothetical protein [Anaerolineae bacterium]